MTEVEFVAIQVISTECSTTVGYLSLWSIHSSFTQSEIKIRAQLSSGVLYVVDTSIHHIIIERITIKIRLKSGHVPGSLPDIEEISAMTQQYHTRATTVWSC